MVITVDSTMTSDKWTRNSTHHLIELFEAHQCLWNLCHDEYKNKTARKRAIDEISAVLDMTPADIKLKIHRLRTQFSNERNRILRAKREDGRDMQRTSKWNYYNHLGFLLLKNQVKIEVKQDPLETEHTIQEIYKHEDSPSEHGDHLVEEVLSENEQQSSRQCNVPGQDDEMTTITVLREASSKDVKYINYEMEQNGCTTTNDMGTATDKTYDEEEIFGKYIASEMRQLVKWPDLRYKLKNGIQRLIWEITSEYNRRSFPNHHQQQSTNRNANSNYYEQDPREEIFLLDDGEN